MQILLTGGAGFIGSHLTEAILARGDQVILLDNLSTGVLKNIEHLIERSDVEWVEGSIKDESLMDELVGRSDHVYHLAAAVGVRLIMEKPVETIETNVRGTEVVLKTVHRHGKKILMASTSEVYGKNSSGPLREGDDRVMGSVMKHRWAYANTKTLDEFLALAYWNEYQLPVVIARLFNTVGPRQMGTYGMVIPNFVQAALEGRPIRVFGDGSQTRCFCHVKDSIRAQMGLMDDPDAAGQVFNIGNPEKITIVDLARRVKEMTGSDSEIQFVSYEEAYGEGFEDMKQRIPDVGKIRAQIGWKPTIRLEESLQSIIRHFEKAREEDAEKAARFPDARCPAVSVNGLESLPLQPEGGGQRKFPLTAAN